VLLEQVVINDEQHDKRMPATPHLLAECDGKPGIDPQSRVEEGSPRVRLSLARRARFRGQMEPVEQPVRSQTGTGDGLLVAGRLLLGGNYRLDRNGISSIVP